MICFRTIFANSEKISILNNIQEKAKTCCETGMERHGSICAMYFVNIFETMFPK